MRETVRDGLAIPVGRPVLKRIFIFFTPMIWYFDTYNFNITDDKLFRNEKRVFKA